ncbi:MAG: hypothetical protein IT450_16570 [Phycisphaerales bacterium]|nr:hypothetical protein [Phycisphaerales bacterium]
MDPEFEIRVGLARAETPSERLEDAIELTELMGELAAAGLRKRFSTASEDEIDEMIITNAIASQERSYRR